MILDTPLDIKGPYQLRGTIDVYKRGNQWLARKWPRKPIQPNSAAQLAVRDAFKKMLAARAAMREGEREMWQQTIQKPGKTWDDYWRSNWLKGYKQSGAPWLSKHSWYKMPKIGYLTRADEIGNVYKMIVLFRDNRDPYPYSWNFSMYHTPLLKNDTFQFYENGKLCFKGKGRLPHYIPHEYQERTYAEGGDITAGLDPPCPSGWSATQMVLFDDFPPYAVSQDAWHPVWLAKGGTYHPENWQLDSYVYAFPAVLLQNTMGNYTR